jgi:hypothetical protein
MWCMWCCMLYSTPGMSPHAMHAQLPLNCFWSLHASDRFCFVPFSHVSPRAASPSASLYTPMHVDHQHLECTTPTASLPGCFFPRIDLLLPSHQTCLPFPGYNTCPLFFTHPARWLKTTILINYIGLPPLLPETIYPIILYWPCLPHLSTRNDLLHRSSLCPPTGLFPY